MSVSIARKQLQVVEDWKREHDKVKEVWEVEDLIAILLAVHHRHSARSVPTIDQLVSSVEFNEEWLTTSESFVARIDGCELRQYDPDGLAELRACVANLKKRIDDLRRYRSDAKLILEGRGRTLRDVIDGLGRKAG